MTDSNNKNARQRNWNFIADRTKHNTERINNINNNKIQQKYTVYGSIVMAYVSFEISRSHVATNRASPAPRLHL